jgi:type IV pilus assembly protein PilY1
VDLSDGQILWSYTKGNNSAMEYSIPAAPAIVDKDNDGFIDIAYIGDMGGNMWKFNFCRNTDGSSCTTADWSGGLFFQSSTGVIRPIFTMPTVARDTTNMWVFWGTGDKTDPTASNAQERFFAVKDENLAEPCRIGDVENIGDTGTYSNPPNKRGWFLVFSGQGEKMLTDPTVFGGMVFFASYIPHSSGSDPCSNAGTGNLYALAMQVLVISQQSFTPGKGLFSGEGIRNMALGAGIPTSPVVSQKPRRGPTDVFISVSGGSGQDTQMFSSADFQDSPLTRRLQTTGAAAHVIHWKDRRLQ